MTRPLPHPLSHPMSISPEQAIAGIADWYGVTPDTLEKMVEQKKSAATSVDHARVQFVYAHMCWKWEEWYQSERLDV